MGAILELPKKGSDDLTDAIETLIGPAIVERNVHQIGWWVADAYLQGMRRFDVVSMDRGELDVSYEETDGNLHLRWEEPLTKIWTEVGRLARLDVSPLCAKRRNSLESLRDASVGQVLLDTQETMLNSDAVNLGFLVGLVQYGTYGIASWRDETRDSPLAHVRELIPPWELLFLPAGHPNPTDLRAVVRTRLFPLAQLLKQAALSFKDIDETHLEIVELPYGSNTSQSVSGPGLATSGGAGTLESLFDEDPSGRTRLAGAIRRRKLPPHKSVEKFVRLREVYTLGSSGETTARYVARAGRAIIADIDYLNDGQYNQPFPIGIARYQSTGHAYGRSFAGRIIPFALELEALLERLIQNMADFDRFGFTMVPNDQGIDFENFKATESPKLIPYERDFTATGSGVDSILPATASDIPGRTFQFGTTLLDRICAQGPLFSGESSKRVDSMGGIDLLAQLGSTHLIPTAKLIKAAYTTMYRHQLHEIRQRLTDPSLLAEGVPITRIENSIAGVTIDAKTGNMSIGPGQVPDPFSIEIGIRSEDPLGGERRREEAPGLLQAGLLTQMEFIILCYKEGWNYPIGSRVVWENYIRAVLVNLILFNDGDVPGELPGSNRAAGIIGSYFHEAADKPEVHLLAAEEFMAGAEFHMASSAVQDAFLVRWTDLKARMGEPVHPDQPTLDEAASNNAAENQGQGQGQPPQGAA
jgi:hypothetical protein